MSDDWSTFKRIGDDISVCIVVLTARSMSHQNAGSI